jgi:hypothetical protein
MHTESQQPFRNPHDHALNITIAATFTAEPVQDALAFWMKEPDLPGSIEFAPCNQVFQQLLDPGSLVGRNRRGLGGGKTGSLRFQSSSGSIGLDMMGLLD